jgi:uncharacterized membrane protein YccC
MLEYFEDIWPILRPFGIFCGTLVYFVVIWYIIPSFGMMCLEKSGNPALHLDRGAMLTGRIS